MPKTKISEFSATANSNTDINSINIAEGCAPSNINDAIRELMAELKDFQAGTKGDSFNGPVGTTTAAAGAFTTLSASSTVSGTGFSTYLASPPAIGGTAAAAGSFTTLTTSSTVTLNGGTANGVVYLNGSKVATSGSALTYNGTTLTAVNNASAVSISLSRTSATARDYALGVDGDGGFRLTDSTGSVVVLSSLPSIAFLASAGDLYFKANNTEGMRLTSTGLGIGTSSPSAPLTVQGSAGGLGINIIGRSAGQNEAWLYWYKNGGSTLNAGILGDNQGLKFAVDSSATERMRLDTSGNLGLGVTPSAWTTLRVMQFAGGASLGGFSNTGYLNANAYFDGSWRYIASATAGRYEVAADHKWFTAASGTAGNAITFTQAMTLDASGNLGIGTTSPLGVLDVASSSNPAVRIRNTSTGGAGIWFGNSTSGTTTSDGSNVGIDSSQQLNLWNYENTATLFATNNTERARITSGGGLWVGTTTRQSTSNHAFIQVTESDWTANFQSNTSTAANALGTLIQYANVSPNSTGSLFLRCNDSVTQRLDIRSNGGIANYSANNVNLSDRREKTNFAPAGEYLSKICAIPVQTFNYIDQNLEEDAGLTLGVVAQDVQAVAPELVMESNWAKEGEEPKMRLSIYQTDLQYALMKCIQEQQAIIEQLKARLDAANL